ncbi:parB-like partition protein [Halothermothrix orenii H 168]|uniref:ParB-like partition protein n=2 Tax=Halothermothrix orenii TaxID=31909 RepID=B8D0M7_HALOH|nr:parB-like partition protein [Halothermothrix orenii H 168]
MDFARIPLDKIKIDKNQSRQEFDAEGIKQLARSIDEVGQLQPVIVKKNGDEYRLVAGERRYRAVKKSSSREKIAALILKEDTGESLLKQIQLIENLQREDLNPLERALSIKRFIDENNLTKKEASKKLGVPRTTLTEWLNILEVPPRYREEVIDEDSPLTLSHISIAKALASRTGDPTKLKQLLDVVLKYNLNRKETKESVNLYRKYLHMPMDEAVSVILLRRERQKLSDRLREEDGSGRGNPNPFNRLLKSFNKTGQTMEEVMEKAGVPDEDIKESLIDEFLYIYQLMEIMVPELKNKKVADLIEGIRKNNSL